jgi:hypothetical protein
MNRLLGRGTLLANRFHISDLLGHDEWNAAYLAADLDSGGAWSLVWESLKVFEIRQKPPGALSYLELDGRHYLVLRLEGQDLGLLYSAAGIVEQGWAALWTAHICDGIGSWHTRAEGPQVCLQQGEIRLADLRLMATGRAILPSRDLLSQPARAIVPGQVLAFSAPEKVLQQPLIPQSDVYALGGILYCLVTGTPPPEPEALVGGEAELVAPRKIQRKLSGRLEKVILRAMHLDPMERHESATQLGFELDRCVPRRLRRQRAWAL